MSPSPEVLSLGTQDRTLDQLRLHLGAADLKQVTVWELVADGGVHRGWNAMGPSGNAVPVSETEKALLMRHGSIHRIPVATPFPATKKGWEPT